MANSSIIGKIKNKIVRDLINDPDIVAAIDCQIDGVEDNEDLINRVIFDFNQNPYTLRDVQTFITIQVHIPEDRGFYSNSDKRVYVKPTIEIWITSHEDHMRVKNIPKIIQNRNDYLSTLIDRRLNGRSDFGIGEIELKSNVETSYEQNYLVRVMIFETKDLNNSLCIDEDDREIE